MREPIARRPGHQLSLFPVLRDSFAHQLREFRRRVCTDDHQCWRTLRIALEPLAVNDMEDEIYATPAISDGRIYLRTRSTLYCFGEK